MRIAHVLNSLGMGGAERVALDLAVVQRRLGHDALVLVIPESPGGALIGEFEAAGIAVHTVPKRPGLDLSLPRKIAGRLRELGVEVVHAHNTPPLIYAAPAARLCGMTVVYTKHGQGFGVGTNALRLARLAAFSVHSFVAVSDVTAEHARANKETPQRGRIQVITNGIRLEKHRPDPGARLEVRRELGIGEDDRVIGTIGRVDDNKNHVGLVRACEGLLADDVKLVMVGDGPAMDKVRAAVARCSRPDSVHMLGTRHDAARLMASFDVFALPSFTEGLPLVILEAMATAVPIVTTAAGGIAKVVEHGVSGYVVPVGDDDAMRQRLAELIDDRERAASLGAAGLTRAHERYSAEHMTRQYLELYRRGAR